MIARAVAPAHQSAGSGGRMLSVGVPQTHGRSARGVLSVQTAGICDRVDAGAIVRQA
jgi:hypothetical protein